MDTSESIENRCIYEHSMHVEINGGEFHGEITIGNEGPKKRAEILEWVSTVPYTDHHRSISDGRLAGTGEWILKKEKYRNWIASNDSMLLLLRGIPGAGKTYIASQVIDWFLSNPKAVSKLAFFYCNRAEESRKDPESILRTLIQQLVQTPSNDELLTPFLNVYKDREYAGQLSSRLTLKECQDLLVQLMDVYPQTTICIDALDEVDHKVRMELLEALKHVVQRSKSLVKIFATTRMDTDILLQFEMFPRIELEPDDNANDISRFVKEKIQGMIERKQLLHGNVPNALKDEICQVLCERSKGMFLLAALHITMLYDMVTADDVRDSLKVLPENLTDTYGEIYNRIHKQGGRASQLALNAFRWVQCSYEPLQSETLLDAVTVEVDGSGEFSRECTALRAPDLLKACQNLLILDERLNVFRFAHLSVEEYFEKHQPEVDSHTEIAKICLSLVCSSRSWSDYDITLETREGRYHDRHLLLYSAVFWPWHFNRCKDSGQILAALWEAFVSEATFRRWIDYHCQRVQTLGSKDTFWLRTEALQQENKDPFSLVCVFGLRWKLNNIFQSQFGWMARIKWLFSAKFISKSIQRGRIDRLLLRASTFGDLDIAQHLLEAGADVSATSSNGLTPLNAAARNGHEELAWLLVNRGADVRAANGDQSTPLHDAAKNGLEALACLLVDRGADVSAVNSCGSTPLHAAAANGYETLARMLVGRGAGVTAANTGGTTPLHDAAKNGLGVLARMLVDGGADVSAADGNGLTPLNAAARNGYEVLAQLLVDRGADVSAADNGGWTPLHGAAQNGHEALALLLVDRGADVSATNSDGSTPLHAAAKNGHEALARLLIDRGADVSAASCSRSTPLHGAAENGHEALVRLLLDQGANVSAASCYGTTPLHVVANNGNETLARLLMNRGANISAASYYGLTPLHIAAKNGDKALALLFVDRGADLSAAGSHWSTPAPLHIAIKNGHEAVVRLLVDRGADISGAGRDGSTPLHVAAKIGDEALARLLLDRGADFTAADGNEWTPLNTAVRYGHHAVARLLVDRGADVSAANSDGSAPLHVAAKKGCEALVRLLVDRGADVSAGNSDGWTPLHDTAQNGHEELSLLLADRGADVSAANNSGWTPLHAVAKNGHLALARLLLDRGADVTAANSDGWTPLHVAAKHGRKALARLLLDQGANVSAADDDGWTPLDVAVQNGHKALAALLAAAVAPPSV